MPWMFRTADFVKRVNQCVLTVRLEGNAKVDYRASRGRTQALPVLWDGIPGMFETNVIPT